MISPPQRYLDYAQQRTIEPHEVHFLARMIGRNRMTHKAYPGGGTICTGAAARIEGTIVHQAMGGADASDGIRIGHPSGVIRVRSEVGIVDGAWKVKEILFSRTARRIMEGYAYVRSAALKA